MGDTSPDGRRSSRCAVHPALSAVRYNDAIVALVARLKPRGRLQTQTEYCSCNAQLLVLCFGVLKYSRPFDAAISNRRMSHIKE